MRRNKMLVLKCKMFNFEEVDKLHINPRGKEKGEWSYLEMEEEEETIVTLKKNKKNSWGYEEEILVTINVQLGTF